MQALTPDHVQQFRTSGFVVVKNVFAHGEVQRFRELIDRVRQRAMNTRECHVDRRTGLAMLIGDLLGKRELAKVDYIIFDPRLLACVKDLLGGQIAYIGDSSAQIGEGTRGWHKDNVDRARPDGDDWVGEYDIVRCGIYLQDHRYHSGGLKLKVGSHNRVSRWHGDGTWGGRLSFGAGRAVNVDTEPGDVVIWSLRTTHSGNTVRVRGLPRLPVHPLLESHIPHALRVPEDATRISIFCTFGAPGHHLQRYIENQRGREDAVEHYRYSGCGRDVQTLAARRGVQLITPTPDYGAAYLAQAVGA